MRAPLPQNELRLAGDPGETLKRKSSCSEQLPETASFRGQPQVYLRTRPDFHTGSLFFAHARADHAPVRNTVLNLDCVREQDYFGD
jgi:hypothetical protein